MDIWTRRNGAGALLNREIEIRNSEGIAFKRFHGPRNAIPWVSTLVPINAQRTNRELTYVFTADTWTAADEIQFGIHSGKPGPNQVAYFKVLNVPASAAFRENFMQRVNSVDEVYDTANSWYLDGSTLHVSAKLNGDDWIDTYADIRLEW